MTSTYTANIGAEKPATGDRSGTWGTMTNTNMDIIDRAIAGVGAITLSGTTHTLTTTDGSLTDGMYRVLVLGGSPSGTNTITISPNDQDKLYFVVNSSGQIATFTQGSGANVSIPNGGSDIIYADGAGSGAAVASVLSKTLTTGNIIIPDAGNIGSASDTDAIAVSSAGVVALSATTEASATTTAALTVAGGLGVAKDVWIGDDLVLDSDATVISFGDNQDVTLTHVHDSGLTLSAGANATALTLTSTNTGASVAPTINLVRDSASPDVDDQLGYINFVGENPSSGTESYAQIIAVITEITDTEEDSKLIFNTMAAGATATNMTVGNTSVGFKVNGTAVANQGFAQNTKMVFYQSSAPTGWAIDTGQNNKALRVVSSSGGSAGGSVAFSTAFASHTVSLSVGATTLSTLQIPSHVHGVRGPAVPTGTPANFAAGNSTDTSSAAAGGGNSHTHTGSSSAINLAVQYCDVMICTKGA